MAKPMGDAVVDAVVIGRNEGARLAACLTSLAGQVRQLIYVDSGSTDGSVALAGSLGAVVVALDMTQPFTAARARNAGLGRLSDPKFVQMVDADCEVDSRWISTALAAYARHPAAVAICGRRREKFPEASVYNRLADAEWDTPVGLAKACGGDVLLRFAAVQAAGGYRDDLIAGEEPDLCLRLRRAGGEVWRIDAEMTRHDANLMRFGQWWQRMRRSGHAFAEGAALHRADPERHWQKETVRAVIWGAALPVSAVVAALVHPLGGLLLLIYPAQMVRLQRRSGPEQALFSVIGKFAEAQGVLGYWLDRVRGKRRSIIEYK